jgi:hypothetical protein
MDVIEGYQSMLDRFNRKRELHHRAHTLYKNRDIKVFTIPLMVVQLLNAILPQISQVVPTYSKLIGIIASTLAAISAIWLGFQAKKRYAERSESHKNAASIFQHLAVLSMNEKQKAKMKNINDENQFLTFQEMAQNLEGKAKDDENLVPVRIVKAVKREKEKENMKKQDGRKETHVNVPTVQAAVNVSTLPAITHLNNGETAQERENEPNFTQYI